MKIPRFFLCAALIGIVCRAHGSGPLLTKSDVFVAGTDGYAFYRIPGLAVTSKGTVLAWCEARRSSSDWSAIDIMIRRSIDGGKTWSPRQKIGEVPGPKQKNPLIVAREAVNTNEITYNNPVAIPDRNGVVHFVFCIEYMRCFYQRSEDDGLSWSKPREITDSFGGFRRFYDWKVLATGPGHGLQLKNRRLLVPVWISPGTGAGAHRPSVTATIFSDDHGNTWRSGEIAAPNPAEWVFPNEAMAVQLADGRVMLNIRTESKAYRRLVTTSRDGATAWSKPEFDPALRESVCMASILRLSESPGKNRILFSNPDNVSRADGKESIVRRDRKNLSLKLSYDEAKTWPINKVLEPGYSAYSDLAVLPDGTILCLYERGANRPDYLTLARFNLEWLTDGRDSFEMSQ